jgi:CheY-like chemotaxis protein
MTKGHCSRSIDYFQHIVQLMGSADGIAVQSPWASNDAAAGVAEDGDGGGAADHGAEAIHGAGTLFSFCVDVEEAQDEPLSSPCALARPIAATDVKAAVSGSQAQAHEEKLPAERSSLAEPVRSGGGKKVAPTRSADSGATTDCQPLAVTVVVVDDELLNRMVLITKLKQCEGTIQELLGEGKGEGRIKGWASEQLSMETVQAEHAESALALMRGKFEAHSQLGCLEAAGGSTRHVHIILLDEHMESSGGVLKGSESIGNFRRLAEKHGCAQPVVVVSSGNCTRADTKLYLKEGCDSVWPKPYPTGDQIAADCAKWICSSLKLREVDLDRCGLRGPCGVSDSTEAQFPAGADPNVLRGATSTQNLQYRGPPAVTCNL